MSSGISFSFASMRLDFLEISRCYSNNCFCVEEVREEVREEVQDVWSGEYSI